MADPEPPKFDTQEEAVAWMYTEVDDLYIDNERFCYVADKSGMKQYQAQARQGCCGSFDARITVAGKAATIGCNYGH